MPTPSSSRTRPILWDPTDTFRIAPDCRCVGWAPSQRRKCLNPISQDNLSNMKSLLSKISRQQPALSALRSDLRCLARYALCVRNHQGQVNDMVEKWGRRMEIMFPNGVAAAEQSVERSSSAVQNVTTSLLYSRSSTTRSSSTNQNISTTSSSSSSSSNISLLYISRSSTSRSSSTAHNRSTTSPSPSPPLSRVSTSDVSSLHLSRSSTTRSSTTRSSTTQPSSTDQNASTTASSSQVSRVSTFEVLLQLSQSSTAASSPSSPTPLTQPTIPRPSRSCTRSHVRRRSLAEECPICKDDNLMSNSPLSELVWCKASCGRSVHKECFEEWRSVCTADRGLARCTMCRSVWEAECACDEKAAEED